MILLILIFLWRLLLVESPKIQSVPEAKAVKAAEPAESPQASPGPEVRGIYGLPVPIPRESAPAEPEPDAFDGVIGAILAVESGGDCNAVGDGGLAIGPYQIHRGYWQDATRFLGVDWPYSDARDPVKASRAVRAYTSHYAAYYRRPWTPETIARIHNGGPTGWKKASTLTYWSRIQNRMVRAALRSQ